MEFLKSIWNFYITSLVVVFVVGYITGGYVTISSEPASWERIIALSPQIISGDGDDVLFYGVLVDLNETSVDLSELK